MISRQLIQKTYSKENNLNHRTNLAKFVAFLFVIVVLISWSQVDRVLAQNTAVNKIQISKIEAKSEMTDEGLDIRIDWAMEKPGTYSYLFSKGQNSQEILARYQPPTTGSSTGGFYIDPDVREGETYTYSVVASDENGDISDQKSVTIVANLADCKVDETEMTTDFFTGTSSLKFSPSRYTLNGGDNNNLIPVGSVQYSLYVAPKDEQQKLDKLNANFTEISVNIYLDGVSTSLREILCKMIAKISPSKLTKVSTGLIDNGASSGAIFTNLPSGDYLLFMSKDGFQGILVEFSLEADQKAKLPLTATALRAEVGAEPPAFVNATIEQVKKSKGEVVHTVNGLGGSYVYNDSYPWWGWQKESALKTTEPQYKRDQPGVVQ